MAWDNSRPVPWRRLIIEYLVIGVVIAAVALMVSKDRRAANYWTIAMAAPIYLGFGYVLAKLGYARKSLAQVRAEAEAAQAKKAAAAPSSTSRPKPAPTSRTANGPSNRPAKKKR
ncbi:MAG: hypothetical protein ACOYMR_17185 [Ilumatobacteraceae bacterium]|jgi:hypothetical protein